MSRRTSATLFHTTCRAALALAVLAPGAASAQSPQAGAAAMEEIIVTARKRQESLIDVPISVTALTAETIEQAGLTSIKDVARFSPNFSFAESFGRTFERPVIRGMSNILGEPNAGIFIDGVFVSGPISTTDLTNLERVEVIRGPQAALYGRATFAGAVNYITKKPTNDPEGRVSATVAEHDEYELSASHSGPVIEDRLFYYVGARHYEYGGEYRNLGPGGGTVGGEQSRNVTGSLRFTPTDWLEATARVSYGEDDDAHIPNSLQLSGANNCFPAANTYYCGVLKAPKSVALNLDLLPDPGLEREVLRGHLIVNADLGGFTLTSSTAAYDEHEETQRDADGVPQNISNGAFLQVNEADREDFAQEIRLTSPGDQPLRWAVGGYYYEKETNSRGLTLNSTGPQASRSPPEEVTNKAIFASVEYDLLEGLTATAEARHAWDRIETSGTSTALGRTRTYSLSETFESTTPRFILTWKPAEDMTLYGSVAKGTKPGGYNTGVQSPAIPDAERQRLSIYETIEEEKAWNYEIGAKAALLGGRARVGASAFYIDWTNQQLTLTERYTNVNGVGTNLALIVNAGKTEVKGLELEAFLQVSEELSLNLGYGLSDATFEQFNDATNLRLTGTASVAGNRTPRAPKHSGVATLEYRLPLANGWAVVTRGDVLFEGTRYVQVDNFTETGSSTKVNLRLTLDGGDWQLAGWVKNVTDDRTVSDATRLTDPFNFRPAYQLALPRGRQFGATGTYRF
ncbi:MAG TPA: TonB-dependent receptor [Azospirillaceae bacterium]|nr:TonB-dependent receptor [Azospirillaceae bacterium]